MNYRSEYKKWLESPALSEAECRELDSLATDENELADRFGAPLPFGTAGLRGVMGLGSNRMNVYVVRWATQAFADVISDRGDASPTAVVCYDCREGSELFAREAACVLAANGIGVRIFPSLRPTPELSFAVRRLHASAGINITASHNTREYNGYKVYWSDGAQLPPERAEGIARRMAETNIFTGPKTVDFDAALASGDIRLLGPDMDEAFLASVLSSRIDPDVVARAADGLEIIYTPFHGAGYELVPEALRRLGVRRLTPVREQMRVDGSFPTVKSPNPENPESFALALALAERRGAGLIIGTDPDSDRIGVMARDRDGVFRTITGNQLGVLLENYIITARRRLGTLPERPAVISTIVTTQLARAVAENNGVRYDETFTGFKFMAEKAAEYERTGEAEYILAFEESCGYMCGDYVRDKDAVTAAMLVCEMASWYHLRGMSLTDGLEELWRQYGWYGERTINAQFPGLDGAAHMRALMGALRAAPPAAIAGTGVLRIRDYLRGRVSIPGLGDMGPTHITGSDVLCFDMEDGATVIVRPSGTEPKIKIYLLVRGSCGGERDASLERLGAFAGELEAMQI